MAVSLTHHVVAESHAGPDGLALSRGLLRLAHHSKTLARKLRRGAVGARQAAAGGSSSTGDTQKKLDVYANDLLLRGLAESGQVGAVISEELADPQRMWVEAGADPAGDGPRAGSDGSRRPGLP